LTNSRGGPGGEGGSITFNCALTGAPDNLSCVDQLTTQAAEFLNASPAILEKRLATGTTVLGQTLRNEGRVFDSSRWDGFELRPGDIIVATPPKCGTTWTQMICALLILQEPELPVPHQRGGADHRREQHGDAKNAGEDERLEVHAAGGGGGQRLQAGAHHEQNSSGCISQVMTCARLPAMCMAHSRRTRRDVSAKPGF